MWPVLFNIPLPFGWHGGSFPLRSFGVMVVLAFLVATAVMKRLARREGLLTPEGLERLFFSMLVAIVVGSRLLYVIVQHDEFTGRWIDVIRIDKGGMVMYGGLLGAVSSGLWFLWRHKYPVWSVADLGGLVGGLGLGIGRIGCLLVGDDYGKPCDASFPLGIRFPSHAMPGSLWGLTIRANNGNLAEDHQGLWLHPTQIYMSINGFLIFAFLWWMFKRRRFHGQIFFMFVILKAVTRSIIEIFRDDNDRGAIGPLSTSQFLGLMTAAVAGVMLYVLARMPSQQIRRDELAAAR